MTNFGLNTALVAAAQMLSVRNDPHRSFNFLVEIEGIVIGGFSEVTGLQIETEVEEYREGGQNSYVHHLAGPTRYPSNLILKHGLTDIETLWGWHQDVTQGKVTRRNGTIYLLDQQRLPAIWWDFREAYPVKWSGPDLRANGSEVAIEIVELVHRGISKPQLSTLVSAARGVLGAAVSAGSSLGI